MCHETRKSACVSGPWCGGGRVGVAGSEMAFCDLSSRGAKGHRSEIRRLTGRHECAAGTG